jgi:hypothetical protein
MGLTVDIGNLCTSCGRDTSFGKGLFVNRIPSGSDAQIELQGIDTDLFPDVDNPEAIIQITVIGHMCADCQCWECDDCGNPMIEDVYIESVDKRICEICVDNYPESEVRE